MTTITEPETRVCSGCHKPLPESAFTASAWRKGGYCRECRRDYQGPYMRARRDTRKEMDELRERVGQLEELASRLGDRVVCLERIGALEQRVAALTE
jgi:hypothetical protein